MQKLHISQSETLEVILCKPQPMACFQATCTGSGQFEIKCAFYSVFQLVLNDGFIKNVSIETNLGNT